MKEPNPNAFIGWAQRPTDAELATALGAAKAAWDRLISDLAALAADVEEWKCYSAKSGWSLRLKHGKRTIIYLAPCAGCIRVAFILGDKAVAAARQGKPSKRLLQLLDGAEKYPEGNGIRLEIRRPSELAVVRRLAEIKLAN